MNEYDTLLDIFRFIRDYSTSTYSISTVCKKLLKHLTDTGYSASVIDSHKDCRTIQVEEHRYKIIKHPEWTHYEVTRTV